MVVDRNHRHTDGPGLRVGLSWRGGVNITHRAIRSLDLDQLAPLIRLPGVAFVSLQYTDCRQELAAFTAAHGLTVHHWQEAIDDYDETAALVSALDLVISVCTAVVHLAGALGKPVWILAPVIAEFLRAVDPPCDYPMRLLISGVGTVVNGREGDRKQRQMHVLQSGSWRRGGHV